MPNRNDVNQNQPGLDQVWVVPEQEVAAEQVALEDVVNRVVRLNAEQMNRHMNQIVAQNRGIFPRAFRVQVAEEGRQKPGVTFKTGSELFTLILQGIREIYDVDAVIAGGAVRDVSAGSLLHNDVDVFIPTTWKKFEEGMRELGWMGPTDLIGQQNYKAATVGGMGFKTTGRARSYVQNTQLDLVFTEKPLSPKDVSSFPLYAQRGVFSLDSGLVLSPEAQKDIEEKQFTIDPSITDKVLLDQLIKKIHTWQKRDVYKDWKIVSPAIKEWWEEQKKMKEDQAIMPLKWDFHTWEEMIKKAAL